MPPVRVKDTCSTPAVRRVRRCDTVRRSSRSLNADRRNVSFSFPRARAVFVARAIVTLRPPMLAFSRAVALPGPGTVIVDARLAALDRRRA